MNCFFDGQWIGIGSAIVNNQTIVNKGRIPYYKGCVLFVEEGKMQLEQIKIYSIKTDMFSNEQNWR